MNRQEAEKTAEEWEEPRKGLAREDEKLKLANGSIITLKDSKCGPFVSNTTGWKVGEL